MDVLFWSELLVVQVSISIERPASTQKVRPMIGRPADVQIWSFNGSCKIGTRWTTAGYITYRSPVKWQKLDVHRMSVAYNKWTNGKWTIGYPMDVLWIMCASRVVFNACLKFKIFHSNFCFRFKKYRNSIEYSICNRIFPMKFNRLCPHFKKSSFKILK